MEHKFKIFTYKEFESRKEELVNMIFNISASYHQVKTYSGSIATEVAKQKYEVLKDLMRYFSANNQTFVTVLMVDGKPVTYVICDDLDNNQWSIARIVTSLNQKGKGYAYIAEKFCLNQIDILGGKTVTAYIHNANIESEQLHKNMGFENENEENDIKILTYQMGKQQNA